VAPLELQRIVKSFDRTTILHGIEDEVIPFQAAREYADLHAIPLIAIEGAGHLFHGKLRALQSQVEALCKP